MIHRRTARSTRGLLGSLIVWVVNRDGTGTRKVIPGPYVWSYGEGTVFAWQPVWPSR